MSANISLNDNATCSYSNDFVIPAILLFGFTALLVLFENILICVAIMSSPLRQITSNFFLIGLAVADMFTSLTVVPLQVLEVWSDPHWPLGPTGVNIYNSLWNFCLVVPFLTVLTITIDRYIIITWKPSEALFLYQQLTVKWVIAVLALVWIYSMILVSLLSLSFSDPPDNEYVWNVPYEYYYPFLAIHVLLPLFVICYCYLNILSTARKSKQQMLQIEDSRENPHQKRNEIKLAKTVGYVILALTVVWIPVLAMEVVYALYSGKSCLVKKIGIFSVWVTCTNGVVNPIIYSIRSRQFQTVLRKLLKCTKTNDI